MAREFLLPGRIFTGTGALEQAAGYLAGLGTKALIVTDPQMRKLGNCGALEQTLTERGIGWAGFDGVDMEPTDKIVEAGLACYQAESCDFLVALGGGSPMDTMKAIGVLAAGTGRSISSYMGEEIAVAVPPMVAIPTTAGTGSTQFTIITDTERDIKMLLKGSVLMPLVAVADPRFTMTAPPGVTASTGLDALCHAVEAYTSRKAQPLSDTFARSAVERIFRALPAAWENGADEAAHRKDVREKRRFLKRMDSEVVFPLMTSSHMVMVCSDHGTSPSTGEHIGTPQPFVISRNSRLKGDLGEVCGTRPIEFLLEGQAR